MGQQKQIIKIENENGGSENPLFNGRYVAAI